MTISMWEKNITVEIRKLVIGRLRNKSFKAKSNSTQNLFSGT